MFFGITGIVADFGSYRIQQIDGYFRNRLKWCESRFFEDGMKGSATRRIQWSKGKSNAYRPGLRSARGPRGFWRAQNDL
jgi:hypothetical protein